MHARVNQLLLDENVYLTSKAMEDAVRFCAHSGDLEGLLAFIENSIDTNAVLTEDILSICIRYERNDRII
jgi:hypothetical protein